MTTQTRTARESKSLSANYLSSILNEFRVKTELYGKYVFPHRRISNLNWTLAFCTPFSLPKFYWCTPVGFRANILCVPCHNSKDSLNTWFSCLTNTRELK